MSNIYAKEECLRSWNANSDIVRHDYFSPHNLEDLHDAYFRGLMWRFSVGDLIYVKDPNGRRAELEVLSIDDEAKTIQMGLVRKIEVTPISASGYAIEKRRVGASTKWCIIGPDGKTVHDDIIGEKRARQMLEEIDEKAGASAVEEIAIESQADRSTAPARKRRPEAA